MLNSPRILLHQIIKKIGLGFLFLANMIYASPQKKRVRTWQKIQGDKNLRLDYALNADSMVFDVGGYEGQWASDIFSMYCPTIHVFEPVLQFAGRIEKRFAGNKKISVHGFGLSHKNETAKISLEENNSSVFKQSGNFETIQLVRAYDFIRENDIRSIDLLKINIEGKEYDLLEHLINEGFAAKIKNIQVQFHDFVPGAESRMKKIQDALGKTHHLTYHYEFVWENWELNDSSKENNQHINPAL